MFSFSVFSDRSLKKKTFKFVCQGIISFALNQLKVELYALMDKRNLHSALRYFTCMYCPKLVIHSNQIKLPMASSVDYIISQMFLPSCKALSLCTGIQNVKKYSYLILPLSSFHITCLGKDDQPTNFRGQFHFVT